MAPSLAAATRAAVATESSEVPAEHACDIGLTKWSGFDTGGHGESSPSTVY